MDGSWDQPFPVVGRRIKIAKNIEVPSDVLKLLGRPSHLRARVRFEAGPTYYLVAKVIYFEQRVQARVYQRGKVALPKRVLEIEVETLPAYAVVDFALATQAEIDDVLALGNSPTQQRPFLVPVGDVARFRNVVDADLVGKPDATITIPSAVLRGIVLARWPDVVHVDLSGVSFKTRVRIHDATEGRDRACVTIPADIYRALGLSPGALAWISLRPAIAATVGRPIVGDRLDWAFFVPPDATAVEEDAGPRLQEALGQELLAQQ